MAAGENICKVKRVTTDGLNSRLLANFQHGHLSKEEAEQFDCALLSNENDLTRVGIVANSKQSYVGKFDLDPICQTMLLIKNKKSNKARIISIPSCRLSLPALTKESSSEKASPSKERIKAGSNFLDLTRLFGSKKSKRLSELGLRISRNTSANADELIEAASGLNVEESDLIEVKDDAGIMDILPPCDRNAVTVSQVYKVDDILNESERNSCKSAAQNLIDNPPVKLDDNHSFFLRSHFKRMTSPSVDNVALLMYADSLIKFLKASVKDLRKKAFQNELCPFSSSVGAKILKEFTVGTDKGRSRPNYIKDKIVCYIIILVLLTCDYIVDMNILMQCFKGINQKKIRQLTRAVGVVPISSVGSQKYTLKLPLPPLPTGFSRQSKK